MLSCFKHKTHNIIYLYSEILYQPTSEDIVLVPTSYKGLQISQNMFVFKSSVLHVGRFRCRVRALKI